MLSEKKAYFIGLRLMKFISNWTSRDESFIWV